MQITPPPNQPVPTPAAVAPQLVRQVIHQPAAPTITPRAIDSGAQGHKGNATGHSTQKTAVTVRSPLNRNGGRGANLDVLV
ncbi:MAG: hypothetical protein KBA75_09035 [Alphaproteobacteria bacterium]|nr:hypothetical protein [Alphaproteobacteria bacterium]